MDEQKNIEPQENKNDLNKNVEQKITADVKDVKKKKGKKGIIIVVLFIIICEIACFAYVYYSKNKAKNEDTQKAQIDTVVAEKEEKFSEYRLPGNSLAKFDLSFLKLENQEVNKVYSPLSIKYALGMLKDGSYGDTKSQIEAVIGDYKLKKYTNSENISLANALFVKDSFKEEMKNNYTDTVSKNYNGEVVYDSFESANTLNKWISEKTLYMINNLVDDEYISDKYFVLVNALSIDQEWVNKIQPEMRSYRVRYPHETTSVDRSEYDGENYTSTNFVNSLAGGGYSVIEFNNTMNNAKVSKIAADVNKYDIINEIGEENIRNTVGAEYEAWLKTEEGIEYSNNDWGFDKDVNKYLDKYISEISENYNKIDSSTDFSFYVDDNVKVFAKDLKEYSGTTLQYIGIMPTNQELNKYIENIDVKDVNRIIDNIKPLELSSFKDGYITRINGSIPLFKFDYKLDLQKDLIKLGITDIFDISKANISNITDTKAVIETTHKANIEFSNDGIKAAAVTLVGGEGAGSGGFDHLYDVPIEVIDLTFDKPFLFIIRDKDSGEVWFTGTVYEPMEYNRGW